MSELNKRILTNDQREDMEREFRGSECSLVARELTWAIRTRAMTTIEDVAKLIDRALLLEREECAKIADLEGDDLQRVVDTSNLDDYRRGVNAAREIAATIRAKR